MSATPTFPRGNALSQFIHTAPTITIPDAVWHEAKRALIDYLGVSIGAVGDDAASAVQRVAQRWQAQGNAQIILGAKTTPSLAALINGTLSHAADYDDTHPAGAGHPSGPCWSTALAMAQHYGADERTTLIAFITGFEVMARLGGGWVPGVGRNLQRRGFHPTSIVGRAGAAAVAASILRLEPNAIANALGAAATMMGGLQKSSGTHGKPFHAGKAAMDGITAAELADEGFVAAHHFYETDGWVKTFVQDGSAVIPPLDFGESWELLGNGYKLYASCRGTHASIETALKLYPQLKGRAIARIHAKVHPMGMVNAGIANPQNPLESKFSIPHCIALALSGYRLNDTDFTQQTVDDPAPRQLLSRLQIDAVEGQSASSAFIDIELEDGQTLHAATDVYRGHPQNPLTDAELRAKFDALTIPVLGEARSDRLYQAAFHFELPGSLAALTKLLAG
ncbi:MmgE/PrpD family protein [Pectobacterium odoriferum]|uniref:MmgE/PrpD family protein n=1 Tax=Pectobacterium odoriferum TaxID=78398 RepID=UPI00052A35C5|nr:MmgE/PrpD family protein [Pectobacterium odoriferum]AIU90085.1 2-methylcitrate dehydratase [Pectobacterium odoriferum]POE16129.1 2-methylcitrate dehydratase [Pectobacterium odoriferum]POE31747.1 2-methylcitrate dehydratase [Pectobacterium odoriferum]